MEDKRLFCVQSAGIIQKGGFSVGHPNDQFGPHRRQYYTSAQSSRPLCPRSADGIWVQFPTGNLQMAERHCAALPTVDNLIALAALLHVRMDDIIITDHSVA